MFALSQQERCKHRNIKDLQLAFSEFYLSLILLQNYQVGVCTESLHQLTPSQSSLNQLAPSFSSFIGQVYTTPPHIVHVHEEDIKPSKLIMVCSKKCHVTWSLLEFY